MDETTYDNDMLEASMRHYRHHESFRYLVKATVIMTAMVCLTVLGVRYGW